MLGRSGTRLQVGTSADLDAIDFAREMRREQLLNEQYAAAAPYNQPSQAPKTNHQYQQQQGHHRTPYNQHHAVGGGGAGSHAFPNVRGHSTASSTLSAMPSLSPI